MILLGLVVVAVTSFGLSAGAAPGDEVGSAQERLAEMRMEASSAYEAHDNAVLQLSELDEEIVQVSRELGEAEGELAEAQGRLEERAAQMYKSGNVGFVDVLVGAEDFSDFAERLDLWMRLLAQERAEFEKVREARDQIAERKASLEAKRERRAAAVGEADDQIDRAAQLEEEAQAYLDSLNAELREAMEAEQAASAERAKQRGKEIRERIAEVEPVAVVEEPAPAPKEKAEVEEPVEPPAPVVSNIAAEKAAADRAAEKAAAERYAAEKAAAAREARRQAEAAEAAEQERLRQEAIKAERRAERAEERAAAQAAAEREARRQARLQAEQQAAAEAAQEQAAQEQAAQEQAAQEQAAQNQAGGAGENQYAGPGAAGGGQPGNNAGGGQNADDGQPAGGGQNTGAGGGSASGQAVVAEAAAHMGTPYSLHSCSYKQAVDCSCFTMLVYQQFGISLVDSPAAQFGAGVPVSGAPMAGDLLFWNEDGSGITHVGIATGNGTTIHASAFAGYVTETAINDIPGYVGARRVL